MNTSSYIGEENDLVEIDNESDENDVTEESNCVNVEDPIDDGVCQGERLITTRNGGKRKRPVNGPHDSNGRGGCI